MNFNVIIPMGGIGQRFSKEGFLQPKPFVKVNGKEILFYVLDSLKISNINNIYIPYNSDLKKYHFEDEILKKYPNLNIKFLCLNKETSGAAETIYEMISNIDKKDLINPFFTLDGDTFYNTNILEIIKNKNNGVIYFKDYTEKPIYSYIKFNSKNELIEIKEKEKISNNANVGIYIFSSGNIFLEYYKKLKNLNLNSELYTSKIYELMLKNNIKIETYEIKKNQFVCLGTPEQVLDYVYLNENEKHDKRIICFDLDNTLVTYPKIHGDYNSCLPIKKNINFLNKLKSKGHHIIIHTARRMKTHNGDVELVKKDIENLTKNQLKYFNIKYDELIFGKPYANFYIDDKSINAFHNLEYETGFHIKKTGETREFNQIIYLENGHVKKSSSNENIKGEIYFYNNIPKNISNLFPKIIEYEKNNYTIEKIQGISFSDLHLNKLLTKEDLILLFKKIDLIHDEKIKFENINIYDNYLNKILDRYKSFDYSKFENSEEVLNFLKEKLKLYENNKSGEISIIHGDPTFTNIIYNKQSEEIKFIDMRGLQGKKLTILGDKFYDYAKIYHSIIGYDNIIKGIEINKINPFKKYFKEQIIDRYSITKFKEIEILTLSLFFSLIPLHEDWKHDKFWKIVIDLYNEIK
jgi:capsule biosynthesis phosphatase